MKTLAYLDCPTGISGDMCLGALVHAGVPVSYLNSQLSRLGIQDEFKLRVESVVRNQQVATRVHVELSPSHQHASAVCDHSPDHGHDQFSAQHEHSHDHSHDHIHDQSSAQHEHSHDHGHDHRQGRRRLPEIEALIQQAGLSARVTEWSLAVFRLLAKAEAAVHGIPPEKVHFHEVGATDAIVDIVGTCLGLDWLQVDAVVCSPLPTGGGTVRCEHGLLPVPAPAVLNMMAIAQIPIYGNGLERELVTPTGCAIAAALSQSFGPPPSFTLAKIGLGAGGRELALPNILRLWIGTSSQTPTTVSTRATPKTEPIVELQTQLDDISPQAIAYVLDQLFAAGAVDVFTQAVTMKKSRLGTLLTVLCPPAVAASCEALLFRETTTLGIRRSQQVRSILAREMVSVSTAYGEILVKVARAQPNSEILNVQPEYEDCAKIARSHNIPWNQVHQAALKAALDMTGTASSQQISSL